MDHYIILLLWIIISLTMFFGMISNCKGINSFERTLIIFIFLLGGPFFALANVLQEILNIILPEGWDSQDDIKKY